jgi:hypothetical protein
LIERWHFLILTSCWESGGIIMGFNVRNFFRLHAVLVAVLLGSASMGWAQIVSGTIVGTVVDSSGAAVPNAKITAANEATGISRSTVTDASGD